MTSQLFVRLVDAIDRGAFPQSRKWVWRRIYNVMSMFWRDSEWRFMNYGYIPPGPPFALDSEDEPERAFIGLYRQAVVDLPLAGARVLEVGSGRGGGARYIARYYKPASVVGVDYSQKTVKRAQALNGDAPGLTFEVGDAENLPFADTSFDIVVNIESSHCYANVPAFAVEVSRVLAPGGWFTFADMRSRKMIGELDHQLGAPGLELAQTTDLTSGAIAALDAVDARKQERIRRMWLMRRFVSEFAGSKGSIMYEGLASGDVVYQARRYRKSA